MTHGAPGQPAVPARRVPVIDDEAGIRSLTARALEPAGFSVALAATGRQGLSTELIQSITATCPQPRLPGTSAGS